MFNLIVETKNGESINLNETAKYQIYQVDGLNPPTAQINISSSAGVDGGKFNSATLDERNIVLYIKLLGDIEKNRLELYRFFRTKEYCKIYYQNSSRNVYTEGYVESFDITSFTNNEIAQISILCPEPYFKDLLEIVDDISKIINRFYFPFSINIDDPIPFSEIEMDKATSIINASECETGLIIEIDFLGNVNKLEIRNTVTGEKMTLNYEFLENDKVIINTNIGSKTAKLYRNSNETNLLPHLQKNFTFFQLPVGETTFSYLADEGDSDQLVSIKFRHNNKYRGV